MNYSVIVSTLTLIALIAYMLCEKFVIPKVNPSVVEDVREAVDTSINLAQKFELIFMMSKKFVIMAKKKFSDGNGTEKREWVIDQLKQVSETLDIVLSRDQLEAINESAYVDMKNAEK